MADLVEQLRHLSELHANGSLSDREFETAKDRLLNGNGSTGAVENTNSSSLLALQNELAALDRKWTLEREQYRVVGRYNSSIPKQGDGTKSGIGVVVAGGIWTAFATFIAVGATSAGAPGIFWIMPVIGILIIVLGLFQSGEISQRADDYARAEQDYRARRAALESKINRRLR